MNGTQRNAAPWFPVALLVMVQVLLVVIADSPLDRRGLWGTDGYMRLARVEALYETGDWYGNVSRRSNAPYGETLHWTRPLDALLLAGAAPLAPIVGFRTALYWWGVLISPVLHVLALLALMWAARPLLPRQGLVYLGVLAVSQPAILINFAHARPDHHGLIGLLFVLEFGFVLRLLGRPFEARTAIAAGAAAAALLWVSVEGMLVVAFALAAMGLGWLAARDSFARKSRVFSMALIAGLVIALLVERPLSDLGAEEYDRLSVVHLFVFATVAVFWLVAEVVERHWALCAGAAGRAAMAFVGVAAAAGVVWLVFPKFFGGPLVDVDPRLMSVSFDVIAEMEPLVLPDKPLRSLRRIVLFVGPALLAVPFLVHLLLRGPPEERRVWMGVALGLALFLPLAFYQLRVVPYAEFLLMLPYTALMMRLLGAFGLSPGGGEAAAAPRDPSIVLAVARAAVVVAFALWFLLLAAVIPGPTAANGAADCPETAMARYLGEAFRGPPRRILGFVDFGPEILYRTRHEVVATPYHRNTGLLDTYDVFSATDDRTARQIVERRGIDLVLICSLNAEAARYLAPDGAPTLYRRLDEGEPPGWLRALPLPAPLGDAYRLFEVTE